MAQDASEDHSTQGTAASAGLREDRLLCVFRMTMQRDGLDHIGADKRQSAYLLVEYQKMLNSNVLTLYDLMINQKRSEEATAKFVSPSYFQHNPLIPDGSVALGQFFAKITSE